MFNLIAGLTETVVKTAVGVPITIAADIATLGGEMSDKRGSQSYTGDMVDSINKSLKKMSD
tara:strand:- start:1 stop:183 length:183 start_codon:yes stop_codon:yes gene_type:complete